MSITTARKNFEKMIGGATEKRANHQVNNNQPHRLVVLVKEEGRRGQGGWQWQLEG